MRLWHEKLIPYLPRQQLLCQHRECCALRGNGWGRKHTTVDYVFTHPYEWLVVYHYKAISEMCKRGYSVDSEWVRVNYRGKKIGFVTDESISVNQFTIKMLSSEYNKQPVYPEHNDEYLKECLNNLEHKGIHIEMGDQHAD